MTLPNPTEKLIQTWRSVVRLRLKAHDEKIISLYDGHTRVDIRHFEVPPEELKETNFFKKYKRKRKQMQLLLCKAPVEKTKPLNTLLSSFGAIF